MDTSTILNPPHRDRLQEWDSLQYRLFRVWASPTDDVSQASRTELKSFVVKELQRKIADNKSKPEVVAQLTNEMAIAVELHQQIPEFSEAQLGHLGKMLEQMATYSQHLSEIFGGNFEHKLTHARSHSPSHINRTLLRQLTTDMRITELAITQRLPLNGQVRWDTHLLYLSDLMAYDALQPLKDAGIVPQETAIITYMQRQTDVRLTPYYHAILLGFPSAVPNRSVAPPHDFLAIPHEIGHYLYRYGMLDRLPCDACEPGVLITQLADALGWPEQIKDELMHDAWIMMSLQANLEKTPNRAKTAAATVHQICGVLRYGLERRPGAFNARIGIDIQFEDVRRVLTPRVHEALAAKLVQQNVLPTDRRNHWLEELFCDAYGCLIAGPINVLGFQTLLSDEQYENDHLHRGKHPIAALRPFILSEMLREMNRRGTANYASAPDLLDAHWHFSPNCRNCSSAAGRYTSAATRNGAFCSRFSRAASLAAVVVLPDPCRPTSRTTEGPTEANCRGARSAPSNVTSSSCTILTSCWPDHGLQGRDPHGLLPDALREAPRELVAHVSLEQHPPDLPQPLPHRVFRQHPTTGQVAQGGPVRRSDREANIEPCNIGSSGREGE